VREVAVHQAIPKDFNYLAMYQLVGEFLSGQVRSNPRSKNREGPKNCCRCTSLLNKILTPQLGVYIYALRHGKSMFSPRGWSIAVD
jgi:hypothetical protein